MSDYTEFQGALDYARDQKQITVDDHRTLSGATRAAFADEPDLTKKDALRVKFLGFIKSKNWEGLKAVFAPGPKSKMTPGERKDFDAMTPEQQARHTFETGRS